MCSACVNTSNIKRRRNKDLFHVEVMELVKQGAEARVFRLSYLGLPAIVKERFKKHYRHPTLDEKLTHRRMLQECRSMLRCRKAGIRTPIIYLMNNENASIYMEEIQNSLSVRDFINGLLADELPNSRLHLESLAKEMGKMIAKLHEIDVIHGDLTTSNILRQDDGETGSLILIDFGLSFVSSMAEDKGVDLYVLERAFLSTHPNTEDIFAKLIESYKENSSEKSSKAVIHKLDEVRLRGRKRVMIG